MTRQASFPVPAGRTPGSHAAMARSAALLLVGLLAGCANVHHVEVGAIPDDYRTRHPIVVGEAVERLDIPVTASETRLSEAARGRTSTFGSRFRRSGSEAIRVELPYGSFNEGAAYAISGELIETLKGEGIAHQRILVQPYHATGLNAAPIKLSYSTLAARTAPCGRFPEDLGNTHENKNYFNFGCASQQNLAAQIADPRDLLSPRGVDSIDAGRRTTVLENYRTGQATASETNGRNESNYDW